MHAYIHTYIHIHTHIHTYIHTYRQTDRQTDIHTCAFASAWDVCWWWYMPRFTVSARTTRHNGKKWDLKESCLFATSNCNKMIGLGWPSLRLAVQRQFTKKVGWVGLIKKFNQFLVVHPILYQMRMIGSLFKN